MWCSCRYRRGCSVTTYYGSDTTSSYTQLSYGRGYRQLAMRRDHSTTSLLLQVCCERDCGTKVIMLQVVVKEVGVLQIVIGEFVVRQVVEEVGGQQIVVG